MVLPQKYLSCVGGLLALLLLVASSGFTMALHSCLMAEHGCCTTSPMEMPAHHHAGGSAIHLERVGGKCCEVRIAGGLNANPAVSEHAPSLVPQKLVIHTQLPGNLIEANTGNFTSSLVLFSTSRFVSPPPVEKYVLDAAFLI